MTDRIIALVDMDCFYVQVEQRLNPSLRGKPCAVVQYNDWKGGGIIAVSYEARDRGVGRHIRGDEAKKVCPEIELVKVPELYGKADLTKYRTAGHEVIEVISQFAKCVERASVDEAYIDLTEEVKAKMESSEGKVALAQLPGTFVVGCHSEGDNSETERQSAVSKWLEELYNNDAQDPFLEDCRRLVVGAAIVEEMRAAIFTQTSFRCSAGIAHNKMLSKLACGLHKPNRQTILPQHSVTKLFTSLPLDKIRNLGGKLGDTLKERLGCQTMADISKYTKEELQLHLGEKAGWLLDLVRGIDHEPVKTRYLPQSIGCSKNFPGQQALASTAQVKMWLGRLATELEERLTKDREANNRIAKSLSVYVHLRGSNTGVSRACGITSYSAERIAESVYVTLDKLNETSGREAWTPPITSLGISATKFQDFSSTSATILQNFVKQSPARGIASISSTEELPHTPVKLNSADGNAKVEVRKESKGVGFFATRFRERMLSPPKKQETKEIQNAEFARLDFGSNIRLPAAVMHQTAITKSTSVPSEGAPDTSDVESKVSENIPDYALTETTSKLGVDAPPSTSGISGCSKNGKDVDEEAGPSMVPEEDGLEQHRMTCGKCKQSFFVWDLPEHNDYHVALELQAEMNASGRRNAIGTTERSPKSTKNKNQGQNKRKKPSPTKANDKKLRSITSFFKSEGTSR